MDEYKYVEIKRIIELDKEDWWIQIKRNKDFKNWYNACFKNGSLGVKWTQG